VPWTTIPPVPTNFTRAGIHLNEESYQASIRITASCSSDPCAPQPAVTVPPALIPSGCSARPAPSSSGGSGGSSSPGGGGGSTNNGGGGGGGSSSTATSGGGTSLAAGGGGVGVGPWTATQAAVRAAVGAGCGSLVVLGAAAWYYYRSRAKRRAASDRHVQVGVGGYN
jgi:hypothetical protein